MDFATLHEPANTYIEKMGKSMNQNLTMIKNK